MRKSFASKEDVIQYKEKMEGLLEVDYKSTNYYNFLKNNVRMLEKIIDNIERKDYTHFFNEAYQDKEVFKGLSIVRKRLVDLLPSNDSFHSSQSAEEIEKTRSRISVIDEELDELAEPIIDYAFETLLTAYNAIQDYQTNPSGITTNNQTVSNDPSFGKRIYLHLDGFIEAYFMFDFETRFPKFRAIDNDTNMIFLEVSEKFICKIKNANSSKDNTSGEIGYHLRNINGVENVYNILSNFSKAVNSFAIERNPDLKSIPPLNYEQRQIAKANIIGIIPFSGGQMIEEKREISARTK